jgi:phosphate/sulfate permease
VAGNFITDPGTAKGFEYVGANITNVQLCTGLNAPVVGCFAQTTCTGPGIPRSTCEFAGQGIAGVGIDLDASAGGTLRAAWTGTAGNQPGATSGARALLRDGSTRVVAADNWHLYNHVITFSITVP